MYEAITGQRTVLRDEELLRRRDENREYMLSLRTDRLLANHANEAGAVNDTGPLSYYHGGWESPMCQLRGHFAGHWLSAAAMHYAATGDGIVKARADEAVARIAEYQRLNGNGWAAPIPEKYFDWIAEGRKLWAPHYTVHKTLMGLSDMYIFAKSELALEVLASFGRWFYDWSGKFPKEQWDGILDVETGGMLEIWAELYSATKEPFAKELMERYYRSRLFDPLLAGADVLTNMHANTTIPEVLGAARAYEVTGDEKWMRIVKAYWEEAVTARGAYCTGGATDGEIWGPKQELDARLGGKNQEHCTVYNMMRLADFLFRHTGEACYADYWERNLYNGVMAQTYWRGRFTHGAKSEHPDAGLLTYFLPLQSGGQKAWATETEDFFCCHGSMVQANAAHNGGIYYKDDESVAVCQYIASEASFELGGAKVSLSQYIDTLTGGRNHSSIQDYTQKINPVSARYPHDPRLLVSVVRVRCDGPKRFKIAFRAPWWRGGIAVTVDGEPVPAAPDAKGFVVIEREWGDSVVELKIGKRLYCEPMPDRPEMAAFMDGPVALAGLCGEERLLYGDIADASGILIPDNEREWGEWMHTFRTKGQERGIRFIPLYRVGYEKYSVYFPIKKR